MLADRGPARRGVLAALARRRVYLTWSSLVGVVIATCLVLLTVTGILLAVAYRPSGALTTYDGVYAPLAGARVSQAYDSVVTLSLETAGGMLVRQTHHWAALVLPAAMVVQLLTKFFSGWFRRPRRGSWVLLVALFAVVLAGGWSGYALPDDMLSGTGLQITQGVVLAIPFVGTRLSSLIFGGGFPGHIIEHLYPIHVYVVPALIVALIAVRAVLARRHGQAVPASDAVRGSLGVRLWPDATLLAVGMAAMTSAVLVLLGAVATITPVWAYGPADPGDAGAGSQPDWYTGFLDGALRLVPSGWETVWSGYTVTFAVLVPLAVVGAWFAAVAVYPFVESWLTHDVVEHHVLDRPRLAPTRVGIGVAGATFYAVLWAAAGSDVIATQFHLSFESILVTLRVALVVGPPIAFDVARRVAAGLQRKDHEEAVHGRETGRIVRTVEGGYVEIHERPAAAEARQIEARTTGR